MQTARATATARTRARILDATISLVRQQASMDVVLNDIAAAAGVSVQTVLRHFDSREGLFEAAIAHARQQVAADRATPVGDIDAAVAALFDHYNTWADTMLALLTRETSDPNTAAATEQGRDFHRHWVQQVFEPFIVSRCGDREAVTDLLVIATDLYTWKLLTRDRRLPRPEAEARVRQLIRAILEATS